MPRIEVTVLFDDPYWIAVVLCTDDDGRVRIGREVLGGEPGHAELREWTLRCLRDVPLREVGLDAPERAQRPRSPKRAAREAARAAAERGLSTKAEDAMRLALEATAKERDERRRARRDEARERAWALRCAKRKAKHRGR